MEVRRDQWRKRPRRDDAAVCLTLNPTALRFARLATPLSTWGRGHRIGISYLRFLGEAMPRPRPILRIPHWPLCARQFQWPRQPGSLLGPRNRLEGMLYSQAEEGGWT